MKVDINGDSLYIDGILKQSLDKYKNRVLKHDEDFVLIIDGRERSGKSTLASQIAYYLDSTFNIDRMCFNADEFASKARECKFQAVVYDEAYTGMSSKETMTKVNRMLNTLLVTVGYRNNYLIIVLPSFFELDKYPALHRSNALLHVYKDDNLSKGYFIGWSEDGKNSLYLHGKKFYSYRYPDSSLQGRFTMFFPMDKEEYKRRKQKSTDEQIESRKKKPTTEHRWLRQRNDYVYYCYKTLNLKQEDIGKIPNEHIVQEDISGIIAKYGDYSV